MSELQPSSGTLPPSLEQPTPSAPSSGGPPPGTPSPRRRRSGLWWTVGVGALATLLALAAVIVIPRVLHAQRVVAYTDAVTQSNIAITQTNELRAATEQLTVMYALQFAEAEDYLPNVVQLGDLHERYMIASDREAIQASASALAETLENRALSHEDEELFHQVRSSIDAKGVIWQTDFLNLSPDITADLIGTEADALLVPVPDEAVTSELVADAQTRLAAEEHRRSEAEEFNALAETRSSQLLDAIAATLPPLQEATAGLPAQLEVVRGNYPNAGAEFLTQMDEAAQRAIDSTTATLFTLDEDRVVPISGTPSGDVVNFEATDAWRATIVATHILEYADAVTSAWVSDAGGIEEALGFNPWLPGFF